MAYLLSTSNYRRKIVTTQGFFVIINITVLIAYVTILGIVCSEIMFPGDLDIEKFILINVSMLGIHIATSGICFLASGISNDMKLAYSIGAVLYVLGILLFSKRDLPL